MLLSYRNGKVVGVGSMDDIEDEFFHDGPPLHDTSTENRDLK